VFPLINIEGQAVKEKENKVENLSIHKNKVIFETCMLHNDAFKYFPV